MRTKKTIIVVLVCLGVVSGNAFSQTITKTTILKEAALDHAKKEKIASDELLKLAAEKKWPLVIKGKNNKLAYLSSVDIKGYPIYMGTYSNVSSAATIRTNQLWNGGSTGLNLSGSSANMKGKLGLWDGARVRATHVELAGRVTQKDNAATTPEVSYDHATHVAGVMISSGVNPQAKGMSFGLQELIAYDYFNRVSELFAESPNLLLSNHSYGDFAGWNFNETENRWEFWGESGANEDYKFGYYSPEAETWDSIVYNAPFHLPVKAVGNSRAENGPDVGEEYWRFNSSNQMVNAGARPAGISDNDLYETIPTYGSAKNILTVGAIFPIPSGYNRPEDAIMTSYSSWGPTDDGRIKPDVVANGEDVLSSIATSDNSYAIYGGTSFSTPAAAGSLILLQEHYSKLHSGAFMRAATLKGLVIHTADETGDAPGPDYQFGWGLINMVKAAAVITANNTTHQIRENVLNNGSTFSLNVIASGNGPLVVTLSWTDPRGRSDQTNRLNNPTIKLIHDLDIRVKKGGTTYLPWILNPTTPSAAATKGDNIRDNVEKIEIPEAIPGETYTIEITHKGTLERGSQAYSLIVSGVGGQAYCASAPTSNTGARIDSVSFGTLQQLNPAGCTSYTDYKSVTGDIEPNSTVPLYVKVSSCDASSTDKIVKAFIDFNSDGDFTDAGEMIAQSNAINGNGAFTANAVIPVGIPVGNYYILRVIVQETANPAVVLPCGNYGKGETQDYRIRVITPSNDLSLSDIAYPAISSCPGAINYVTVVIKNLGSVAKSNVPVSATVKSGATTISNLNAVFSSTIPAFGEAWYTFQTPFTAQAGNTYTITADVTLAGDQEIGNNQQSTTLTVDPAEPNPTGQAEVCGNQVLLRATSTPGDVFLWYDAATAVNPIASGTNTSSNVITTDKTYHLAINDLKAKLGPQNKLAFPEGGYNAFAGNFVRFTNTQPLIIETARLYIGNPGKITFIVADIVSFDPNTGAYSYYPISATQIDAYATDPTPQAGAQIGNDPADLGAIFQLNLPVPTAGSHAIIVICEDGATIFRNNNIAANPYPFSIPGVISITGNSAINTADPDDATFYQRFYYFFYDVSILLAKCPSARVPIVATTATAPTITLAGTSLSSSIATGNQWYLNGVSIPGATGQNYVATQTGNYRTEVTDNLGCTLSSNELSVTVTAVPNIDPAEIGLKVLPNPSDGKFFVEFTVNRKADLVLSLSNMVGQEVYRASYPGFAGKFNKLVSVPGKLSSGIYLLKVNHNNKNYTRKLVIR